MMLVLVESPFAGDVPKHQRYVRAAMNDCLLRGEAPFASHALYTQPGVLDDSIAVERTLGIEAGLAWGRKADKTVCYTDCGISGGMRLGLERAHACGRPIEFRSLASWVAVYGVVEGTAPVPTALPTLTKDERRVLVRMFTRVQTLREQLVKANEGLGKVAQNESVTTAWKSALNALGSLKSAITATRLSRRAK